MALWLLSCAVLVRTMVDSSFLPMVDDDDDDDDDNDAVVVVTPEGVAVLMGVVLGRCVDLLLHVIIMTSKRTVTTTPTNPTTTDHSVIGWLLDCVANNNTLPNPNPLLLIPLIALSLIFVFTNKDG